MSDTSNKLTELIRQVQANELDLVVAILQAFEIGMERAVEIRSEVEKEYVA